MYNFWYLSLCQLRIYNLFILQTLQTNRCQSNVFYLWPLYSMQSADRMIRSRRMMHNLLIRSQRLVVRLKPKKMIPNLSMVKRKLMALSQKRKSWPKRKRKLQRNSEKLRRKPLRMKKKLPRILPKMKRRRQRTSPKNKRRLLKI